MISFFAAYGGALLSFLIMDGIWLGFIAKQSYQTAMAGMLRAEFITWPWIVFYLFYCAVIAVMAVLPHHAAGWKTVLFYGALLGAASYGAYNLTNYSILEGWKLGITLQDWAWGVFVTGMSALAGYASLRYWQ